MLLKSCKRKGSTIITKFGRMFRSGGKQRVVVWKLFVTGAGCDDWQSDRCRQTLYKIKVAKQFLDNLCGARSCRTHNHSGHSWRAGWTVLLIVTRLNPRGRSPRRAARGGSTASCNFVNLLSKPSCALPSTKSILVVIDCILQGKRRVTSTENHQNVCQTGARKLSRFFQQKSRFLGSRDFTNAVAKQSSS